MLEGGLVMVAISMWLFWKEGIWKGLYRDVIY